MLVYVLFCDVHGSPTNALVVTCITISCALTVVFLFTTTILWVYRFVTNDTALSCFFWWPGCYHMGHQSFKAVVWCAKNGRVYNYFLYPGCCRTLSVGVTIPRVDAPVDINYTNFVRSAVHFLFVFCRTPTVRGLVTVLRLLLVAGRTLLGSHRFRRMWHACVVYLMNVCGIHVLLSDLAGSCSVFSCSVSVLPMSFCPKISRTMHVWVNVLSPLENCSWYYFIFHTNNQFIFLYALPATCSDPLIWLVGTKRPQVTRSVYNLSFRGEMRSRKHCCTLFCHCMCAYESDILMFVSSCLFVYVHAVSVPF